MTVHVWEGTYEGAYMGGYVCEVVMALHLCGGLE